MERTSPSLTAIVAATPQNVIGLDGDMPWRLSSDLRRFKTMTMGGVMLMGRKTFDSIGRPLPGRRTVVLTRNEHWSMDGVETAVDPESAVAKIGDLSGFVVGGAEIYRLLMPFCDRVLMTRVWSQVAGDTRLEIELADFEIYGRMRIPGGARDDVPTEFQDWRRKKS
jgi:dihydrofolate reductase